VFVVSDHGAKAMMGGVCINEWLIERGWLALKERPSRPTPLERCEIDWSRTRAWGEGGYYGRVFLNVKGREPQGVIEPDEYERERKALAEELGAITDPDGAEIGVDAYRPEDVYAEVTNVAPDLIVYFGDLDWRSVGSVGVGSVWTFENDTGPDDANHAQHGIFILHDPAKPGGGERLDDLRVYDVAPTILTMLGQPVPEGTRGKVIA
jgi:predicted AlkP superfamily phosphohydrolase/phosphomutase